MLIYYDEGAIGHDRAEGIAKREELGKFDFGKAPSSDMFNVCWKPLEIIDEQGGMKVEAYEGEVRRDDGVEVRHG